MCPQERQSEADGPRDGASQGTDVLGEVVRAEERIRPCISEMILERSAFLSQIGSTEWANSTPGVRCS